MGSHHEMLTLAAPFVRRGLRVDLAAADRRAGGLQFMPVVRDGWRETLSITPLGAGRWRLLRRAAPLAAPFEARLELDGPDPAALLARADAQPAATQWLRGEGWSAALHRRGERCTRVELHAGRAQLELVPGRRAARLVLGGLAAPPDDLLAVLGWAWSPLVAGGGAWRGSVKLGHAGLAARLRQAGDHLVRTLDEPPAAFHRRHARTRWLVAARRAVPLALWLALVALVAMAPELRADRASAQPLLMLLLPPALLALFVATSEAPRLELPPLPRASGAAGW